MTTAVPFALPTGGRYGVSMGRSVESAPSAPGAPFVHRGIAGCARATSGRSDVAVVAAFAPGDAAGVAGTLAQPGTVARRITSDAPSDCNWRCERIMARVM